MKPALTVEQFDNKIEEHKQGILEVIKDNPNIYSVSDIFIEYHSISKATFYNYDLDKLDEIKEALDFNKSLTKNRMLKNWTDAAPVLQIGAYKLLGTQDERMRLSQTFVEQTSNINHNLIALPDSDLDTRIKELERKQALSLPAGEVIDV